MPLTDEDLAYMRATQEDHRPTAASLIARREVPDGRGGRTTTMGEPQPIDVRVSHQERRVPDALVAKYGAGIATITMPLVEVRSGDQIKVSATEAYEVVSDGDTADWTTAQQVFGVRRVFAP